MSEDRGRGVSSLALAGLVAAWEAACRHGLVSPLILPAPSRVAQEAWSLAASGALAGDLRASLTAFLLALLIAALLGGAAGLAMGASRAAERLLDPVLTALNAVPKVALMPLVVLWFGLGLPPAVFMGALMGAFPVAIGVRAGARGLERDFVLLARAYGASRLTTLRCVLLPGLLPHFLASLRLAVNYALVGVLVVEFFAAGGGLGYRLVLFASNFQTARFFAVLLLVMILALAFAGLVGRLERRVSAWRPEPLA